MRRGLQTSKYNLLPELHYGSQIILKPHPYPKAHLTRQTSRRAGDVIEYVRELKMRIKFFNSKIDNVKSEKGFTLVELIFVTVVTGILSSSLMLPLMNSMKKGTRPEIYATATYMAEKELEELKNAGYTNIADGSVWQTKVFPMNYGL